MDENAKKALLIGISIFISIIIISIVVISISAANKAETIAKEYTGQGIKRDSAAQSLLSKDKLVGEEVIYLLQAAKEEKNYNISIYKQPNFPNNLSNININNNLEWIKDYDKNLGTYIKSEYTYSINVTYGGALVKVILTYQ